jgi:hypothetical protein
MYVGFSPIGGVNLLEILTVLVFYLSLFVLSEILAVFYSRTSSMNVEELNLDAGRWVGKSENIIVMTLMLLEAYTALGLIFAAKGLIRWEGIKKRPDYYVMGTMVNFACSIALGGVLLWIVKKEQFYIGFWGGIVMLVLAILFLTLTKLASKRKPEP